MLKIFSVDEESIGSLINLQQDDTIVAFNGQPVCDVLDYAYYDSQERFTMSVKRVNGQVKDFDIRKTCYDSLGLDFYEDCYLEPDQCANNCIFCFVNQLPQGLRDSLYVRDDDWRLSFVSGNYITLSHISEEDIERIISKQFSPLYISVHATDDEVRSKMLGRYNCRPLMPLLKRLASNKITMHAQIVLCPSVNDEQILEKTLTDLYSLYPYIASVAVVPVGLTKFRQKLPLLNQVNEECATSTIQLVENFAKQCYSNDLNNFAYCSDEMYIIAQQNLPSYEYYGDFDQYENGVGLIARFNYDWEQASSESMCLDSDNAYTLVCGIAAFEFLNSLITEYNEKFDTNNNVIAIRNDFFGDTVNVSGLIVGQDIIKQLKGQEVNNKVLLPRCMLRETEDVFLDNTILNKLKEALNREVEVIDADGYMLYNKLSGVTD